MNKDLVMPNYNHSILNTVTSILKYFNVASKHASLEILDKKLTKKYKNVVLIVLDGLGEHILQKVSPDGFFMKNKIDVLTSVFPSTTTAALTTYYSGNPPYETGWIAWSQYFKEYGRALDMLPRRESYKGESIKDARMNVFDTIVNYKTIFEKIEEASPNVSAIEITPSYAERRSKKSYKAENIDEALEGLKLICKIPDEKFVMVYSDNPDSLLHKYGTSSVEAKEFILETERKIEKLAQEFSEDTILIISADHGHKDIEKAYTLLDYPEIQECLILPPSLESRTISFWVKEDMKKVFEERFNDIFKEEFKLFTKQEFLEKHFLGYGEKHKKIDDFLGNYVAVSIAGSIIRLETFLAEGKPIKKSTHCGLTKEEMEVPLIVI